MGRGINPATMFHGWWKQALVQESQKTGKETMRDLKVEEGYARAEATRLNFHTALLTLSASSLYLFLSPMHICFLSQQ